jgi:hypothetical protein
MAKDPDKYVLCQKCLDKIERKNAKWVRKMDFIPHQYALCNKCFSELS